MPHSQVCKKWNKDIYLSYLQYNHDELVIKKQHVLCSTEEVEHRDGLEAVKYLVLPLK